jgi:hypothetical protein
MGVFMQDRLHLYIFSFFAIVAMIPEIMYNMDVLPPELKEEVYITTLGLHPELARVLICISQEFNTLLQNPHTVKKIMNRRPRTMTSYEHACAMNTAAAKYYAEENERLYAIDVMDSYSLCLRFNSFADINYVSSCGLKNTGRTKLYKICMGENNKTTIAWINFLLSRGANINEYYVEQYSCDGVVPISCNSIALIPAILSSCKGNADKPSLEVVELLLKRGASPNNAPLLEMAIIGENSMACAQLLCKYGARVQDTWVLHNYLDLHTTSTIKLPILKLLVQHGCDPYTCTDNLTSQTAFEIAREYVCGEVREEIITIMETAHKNRQEAIKFLSTT